MSSAPKKSAKTVQSADDQDITIDPLAYFKPTKFKQKHIKNPCQKCGSEKHLLSDCPSWISELDKKQVKQALNQTNFSDSQSIRCLTAFPCTTKERQKKSP
jgi:tRNA G26 N,N-dimethylase Trm1